MAKIINIDPPLPGEETLKNTRNLYEAGLFIAVTAALIGVVAWVTINVADMAMILLIGY